jgi:hypothetical protein
VSVSSFLLLLHFPLPYVCSSRSFSLPGLERETTKHEEEGRREDGEEVNPRTELINSGQQPYMNGNGGGMMAQPTGFY